MQVINPGLISGVAPDGAGAAFYDQHPMLVTAADVAIQVAFIAAVLAPLHTWLGPWDLLITAMLFFGFVYIVWRTLYERFLAPDRHREFARGWLAARPLVGAYMIMVVLPLRLILLSAATGAIVYDLVIDHGLSNPFGERFDAWGVTLFFIDQSFRRVLFDALGTFGIAISHLTLAPDASWLFKTALVPFRMVVEAISFGYVWYLLEPYWRVWNDRAAAASPIKATATMSVGASGETIVPRPMA